MHSHAGSRGSFSHKLQRSYSSFSLRSIVLHAATRVRTSLWFVPAAFVAFGVLLAIVMCLLEDSVGPYVRRLWPSMPVTQGDGARSMLAAIATSMATIAGVAFSMMTVVITLAASQYSPNVIRNFMRDRTHQAALGTFVGIFAYCLVVLRMIEPENGATATGSVATAFALLLALFGIVMLIYFIHHVAISIEVSHIIGSAFEDTQRAVRRTFKEPSSAGKDPCDSQKTDESQEHPTSLRAIHDSSDCQAIVSQRTGYVVGVDVEGLVDAATHGKALIQLDVALGDFVIRGQRIAKAKGQNVNPRELAQHVTVVRQRLVDEDPSFGIRQIVDIALKALSPGINDVTTAATCIDYLSAILLSIAGRAPMQVHYPVGKGYGVIVKTTHFEDLVELAFCQIRQNGGHHARIYQRLVASLTRLEAAARTPMQRAGLAREAELLRQSVESSVPLERDRQSTLKQLSTVQYRLKHSCAPHRPHTERTTPDESLQASQHAPPTPTTGAVS